MFYFLIKKEMKKIRTLFLLVGGAFLIGGGAFYLQTVDTGEEVVLYGATEEVQSDQQPDEGLKTEVDPVGTELDPVGGEAEG
jgi:hypothetical protein